MASPLQFAYRTQKTIGIFDAAPVYQPLAGFAKPEGNLRCSAYSPCGRFFGWATPEFVTVVDTSAGSVVLVLPLVNVYELGFSPCGTFVITWERPGKDEAGDATKNLKVWRTVEEGIAGGDKQPIGRYVQKQQGGWNLQYTADEKYCARLVTNEVQFFESHDLVTVWNKLRVEGAASFALAPGSQNHAVAVFIPEKKVSQISTVPFSWNAISFGPCASPRNTQMNFEMSYDLLFTNRSLLRITGSTSSCQGVQRPLVPKSYFAKDLFQGRQGSVQVEQARVFPACPCADGRRQIWEKLLR